MNKLFKDSFLVILAKIISLILGFISSIFFIRLLGATGKGNLSKIEVTAGLLVLLTSINLNSGIIHFISKDIINKRIILGISYIIFLFSILSTIIIIVLVKTIDTYNILLPSDNFFSYAILILLLVITLLLKEIFSSFLKGLKKFNDLYISTLVYSIIRLLLFSTLFILFKYFDYNFSIIYLITFHLLTQIFLTLLTYFYFNRDVKITPDFNFNKKDLKTFINYILAGLLTLIVVFFLRKIDIWIIDYKLGKKQLGYFAIAIGLSELILQFPMTLKNVLFPYLSSAKTLKEKSKLLSIFSKVNFTILIILTSILFFLAPYIIHFMYGKDFIQSILPFKIILIGVSFIGFKSFFQIFNMSNEKQIYNIWINIFCLILLIGLDLYLIPKHGIIGASTALTIVSFISLLLIFYSVNNLQKLPKQKYFFVTLSDIKKIYNLIRKK